MVDVDPVGDENEGDSTFLSCAAIARMFLEIFCRQRAD